MKDMLEELFKRAEDQEYFFLPGDANAPNNSSTNLQSLIRKAKPIADTLNRHINIYGWHPDEGMNFIVRVLPGGEISDEKMVTAKVIESEMVTCTLPREDLANIMKNAGIPKLTEDMQKVEEAFVGKPMHRKIKDKEVRERESEYQGFSPDTNVYNKDEEETEDLFNTYSHDEEISLSIKD